MDTHSYNHSPHEQGQQRQSQAFSAYSPTANSPTAGADTYSDANYNLHSPTSPTWRSSMASTTPLVPVPAPAPVRKRSQTDNGIERHQINPLGAMNMDPMGPNQPPRQHDDEMQRLQVPLQHITPMNEFDQPTLHRALNANQVWHTRYLQLFLTLEFPM
jgi:hypothetical protein